MAEADLIVKGQRAAAAGVCRLIRAGQTLFTYFHFAASRELTEAMLASPARPASPMKRSATLKAGCRCSRR